VIVRRRVLRFTGMVLTALSTGVLFGTRTSLGPSTRTFSPATYVEVQQATVRNLRPVMGTLLPAAVASQAALLVVPPSERRSPAFALTIAGFLSQLASLVLTGAVELPINSTVLTWAPHDPPAGWEQTRDRWHAVHTLRTATSLVGLGCAMAAALASSERSGEVVRSR
jgi:Domain of unknown function (DUF1772)